jgi:serine/threonine protein kinase
MTVGAADGSTAPEGPPARPASLPAHVRLVEPIGAGGSGIVWRARDRRAGRDVAVKVVALGAGPGGAERRERFEREARALARLGAHPAIPTVHQLGVGPDGMAWLVTDLVADGSLARRVDAGGALPVDATLVIGTGIAAALDHAHRQGVVHGDVTPANVLLRADGTAVLADLGAAALDAAALGATTLGAAVASPGATAPEPSPGGGITPAFAAPERLDGAPATAATDVFGLGATLRFAATGRLGAADDVPRGLDGVVRRCCAPDAGARPTAAEAAALLADERRRRAGRRRG